MNRACGVLLAFAGWVGPLQAAVVEVAISSHSFSPAVVEVQVGDSVRWTLPEEGGGDGYGYVPQPVPHNVRADDGSFSSGVPRSGPWSFSHTFESVGEFAYYCELHGAANGVGMSGRVRVVARAPTAGPPMNEGLSGAWFDPATSGQGFFIELHPQSQLLALAWFTWAEQPGVYDWLTAAGPYTGQRAELLFNRSRGGRFNAPTSVTDHDAGSGTLTFIDCDHAELDFLLTDPPRQGRIELTRLLAAGALCTDPAVDGDSR